MSLFVKICELRRLTQLVAFEAILKSWLKAEYYVLMFHSNLANPSTVSRHALNKFYLLYCMKIFIS